MHIQTATVEELMSLNDIGPVGASYVVHFFAQPHNLEVIQAFIKSWDSLA